MQHRVADGFEWFVDRAYQPVLRFALANRYLVLSVFVGGAMIVFALVSSGNVRFIFFPRVQSEVARANLVMPDGTPFEVTQGHIDRMQEAVYTLQAKYVDPDTNESVIEGIMATAGSSGGRSVGSNVGRVVFEITPPEDRTLNISSRELVTEWRRLADIASQVRTAYLGAQVQSIQRDRDEVDVIVRYPAEDRDSISGLRRLNIRTASGVDVPLATVATIETGRGLSSINRVDRRRVVSVEAEVDKSTANIEGIKADLRFRFAVTCNRFW